jgi:hypothetical protein
VNTKNSDSVKLIRDMRGFPPACYRLEADGRKWRSVSEDRKTLALLLATYGDGDGTRIMPGIRQLVKSTGWSRAKVCRVLTGLQAIGCLSRQTDEAGKSKIGPHGTAMRLFDVEPLQRAQDALDRGENFSHKPEVEVPDSSKSESQIQGVEVSDSQVGVSNSRVEVSPIRETEPPPYGHPTATQPTGAKPEGGGNGSKSSGKKNPILLDRLSNLYSEAGHGIAGADRRERTDLDQAISEWGEGRIEDLFRHWLAHRTQGFEGMKKPIRNFLIDLPATMRDYHRVSSGEEIPPSVLAAMAAKDAEIAALHDSEPVDDDAI